MIERIKEFRFKAAEYANEQKPLGIMKWNEMRDAKFAELIIRECAKVVDDKLSNPSGASMAYCDGSDLLEHFGVEE